MIDVFVTDPTESGFIIFMEEENVGLMNCKYIGHKGTYIARFKPLKFNIEHECLDTLTLFPNDDEACKIVNKIRDKGINARLLSVYRGEGYRSIESDETDDYMKIHLIVK